MHIVVFHDEQEAYIVLPAHNLSHVIESPHSAVSILYGCVSRYPLSTDEHMFNVVFKKPSRQNMEHPFLVAQSKTSW